MLLLWTHDSAPAHPVYVSMTEIRLDRAAEQMEVAVTVFSDDIIRAVSDQSAGIFPVMADSASLITLAVKYVIEHLRIRLDSVDANILTERLDIDPGKVRTRFTLRLQLEKPVTSISIENRIFLQLFETQKNMIRLHVDERKYSYLLQRENPSVSIRIDDLGDD